MDIINYTMTNLLNSLLQGFNIGAKCVNAKAHRHFAFYDIVLDHGTKLSKLASYSKELSLAMKTKTDLIVTAIPEKGIVRLHTTSAASDILDFDKLYSKNQTPQGLLPFLLGETAEGNPLWVDMSKNPHLLVAGSTGSGKSCFLHALIANAAKREDTKLHLIDTKRVDFGIYNDRDLRLLVHGFADDYNGAIEVLKSAYVIMEARYQYMSQHGIRSVEQRPNLFNKILIIIDEAADLMLYNKTKEFEHLLVRLAQKARAAGIYLVLATQRPSTDVLTGLIKSNFPARVSCKVATKIDSRVVLDQHGAENLAGRGDAIIKQSLIDTSRFQVAFVDPKSTVNSFKSKVN
ncbi:MAG: FtsK/SpoIIIE domain-containing protein [bacterium]|nr:FtsK/SpoIIIE domain-containing protein [bacterium]